jgi:GTP-binding protein Era
MSQPETRAGFVAIIGLPNVGKSTLLNRFLGSKLSIVSPAAQTTRERVVGIDTRAGAQIVFMDTPGLVDPAYLLHHSMLGIIEQTIRDADVIVLLLDGTRAPPNIPLPTMSVLESLGDRLIVAINKGDRSSQDKLKALQHWADQRFSTTPAVISAETGEGVEELRGTIAASLPESPFLYPSDDISTQTVRFFVAELIRETIFEQFKEEIPYSAAVRVEEFRESDDPLYIGATVFVERQSQKGIVIGRGGGAIRDLGSASRVKIEAFVDRRVYLKLRVKVLPKWRKDPLELGRLGFPVPPEGLTSNA